MHGDQHARHEPAANFHRQVPCGGWGLHRGASLHTGAGLAPADTIGHALLQMYNFTLVESRLVFNMLYSLIKFAAHDRFLDPPAHYFR